jgi:steroid delta-isomerase-like uncharacterized protein
MDREGWVAQGQMFYAAFPDGRHEIQSQYADGDVVVTRATWTGTHKAPFMGIPTSGKSVAVPAIMIHRFAGGRVAEHWGLFDAMALMQQIGAMPG